MNDFADFDRHAMARALALAALGRATTQPNPRVGCVFARDGRIVGEGWHARAGQPHAEVLALQAMRAAGVDARGTTAYVTLEPCSHHGRTPPCTDALAAAGVVRVVYANDDPDPRVDGRGAAQLRARGIRVERGLMAAEAEELNLGFNSRCRRGRPWLRLKLAASLDGRTALADGASQWITSEAARADVQQWRAESAAILTGIGTVLADDPALTVRVGAEPRRQPLRVVLDSRLRLPATARLLREPGMTLLVGTPEAVPAAGSAAARLPDASWQLERVAAAADGRIALAPLLARLGVLQVNEAWVEAGPALAGALLRDGLVDELIVYLAPTLLGPQARPLALLPQLENLADRPRWQFRELRMIGPDARIMLRPGG
jgi:diaminohydroxyphosphoribosylaminopyrimidine deaminase/5-amino-6-(5-phosphoribosylamino)uracil reductase